MNAETWQALAILAAASASAGLGWTGLLLLRHRSPWRIGGGVALRAAGFAAVRLARALCVWLAIRFLTGEDAQPLAILTAVALGCAPLLFSFLHFVPHFGWIVLGVLEAVSFGKTALLLHGATQRSMFGSLLTLAASWLLVWLVARLLDVGAESRRDSRAHPHPRRLTVDEALARLPEPAQGPLPRQESRSR